MKWMTGVLGVLLWGLWMAPAVIAQESQRTQDDHVVEVGDAELVSVARAYVSVQDLLRIYQTRLEAVRGAERAKALQQQFARQANEAIVEEGVSLERYDAVIRAANEDDVLRERLTSEIAEVAAQAKTP